MNVSMIDSLPYIIFFLISILYTYILKTYNIRKKRLEKGLFSLLILGMFYPLIISIYSVMTRDLHFSHIFKYTYSGMSSLEVFISTFYSFPSAYVLPIIGLFLVLLRIKYLNINRFASRRTYLSYPSLASIIFLLYSLYPPFNYLSNMNLSEGMGPYPFYMDPLMLVVIFSLYIVVITGLISSAYYMIGWLYQDDYFENLTDKLVVVMGIFSVVGFSFYMYFMHMHYIENGFFFWGVTGYILGLFIVLTFLYLEILSIRGKRLLGALSFTAYVTTAVSLLLLFSLNPENIVSGGNIDLYEYIGILTLVAIMGFFLSGMEIFKKFFLPWDDESIDFLKRFPSMTFYVISLLIGLFLFLNLSIYYTLGNVTPLISKYYYLYLIANMGLAPFTSMLSSLLSKLRSKLSYVSIITFIILIVFFVLIALDFSLTYLIYSLIVGLVLSIPVFLYPKGRRGFPVSRLLLITVVILLLFGVVTYNKGPIKTVEVGNVYAFDNMNLKISNVSSGLSDVNVISELGGNSTYLYKYEKATFDNGVSISKLYYPNKDFTFFNNYKLDHMDSTYYICLSSVAIQQNAAYIYNIHVTWVDYYYIVVLVFLVISILLVRKDNLY